MLQAEGERAPGFELERRPVEVLRLDHHRGRALDVRRDAGDREAPVLLPLLGEDSLLQQTFARLAMLTPPEKILVVCGPAHAAAVLPLFFGAGSAASEIPCSAPEGDQPAPTRVAIQSGAVLVDATTDAVYAYEVQPRSGT